MAERVILTDKLLKAMAVPGAKRFDVLDALVPGLLAVVYPSGVVTLQLRTRVGSKFPRRRAIGRHGTITIEQARRTAREWLTLLHSGGSPEVARAAARDEQRRARLQAEQAADNTFGRVADDFIARHLRNKRKARKAEREIRNELIAVWGARPIADITRKDVVQLIETIADRSAGGSGAYGRNIFGYVRTLFNWAIARSIYGIEHSPTDRLKPKDLLGPKVSRERVLSDDELRALWRVADRLRYPYGPALRLLLLTGARLSEVSGMRWREIDFANAVWTIPAERYKTGQQHRLPLTDDAVALLQSLPRFRRGDACFSTFGVQPINGWSAGKRRIDRKVLRTLRALARWRGDDPAAVEVAPWVLHDIRRTVRTRLAALRIQDHVAEQVLGHSRKGIAGVYDRHRYLDEVREALEAWQGLLRSIVAPTAAASSNVVPLRTSEGTCAANPPCPATKLSMASSATTILPGS
jgi:integrase